MTSSASRRRFAAFAIQARDASLSAVTATVAFYPEVASASWYGEVNRGNGADQEKTTIIAGQRCADGSSRESELASQNVIAVKHERLQTYGDDRLLREVASLYRNLSGAPSAVGTTSA
jgi:hypothetical protein